MEKFKSWSCKKCMKRFVSKTRKVLCPKCLARGNIWPTNLLEQHNKVTNRFEKGIRL